MKERYADLNTALANLTYSPTAEFSGIGEVEITVDDRGNSGVGGSLTATEILYVEVLSVNDAPVLDNLGTPAMPTISEDDVNNGGLTVAALLATGAGGDPVSDVEGDPEGIAITDRLNGRGMWQYSIDGGSSWLNVGTVSETSALLLRDTDLVRFKPNGENGITNRTIDFRAWDQTSGTAGTKVNVSSNGGSSAFSVAIETATVDITDVNDAPVLDNSGAVTLDSQDEDSGSPSGAVGTLISDLVSFGGNVTDVDASANTGVAITDVDETNGSWWFSTDGGSNWNSVGSLSDASALVLNADSNTRLYFEPNANYNGTINDAITFRAWDQTVGANGSVQDASTNGGTTAYSSATETADLTINSINDAPSVVSGGPYSIDEGQDVTFDATGTSDVEGDSLTYRWDIDNDGTYDIVTASESTLVDWSTLQTHGIDDDGSYTIGLQVDDGNTGVTTVSTTLNVANIAPSLSIVAPGTVTEGVSETYTLSAIDPGDDTIVEWVINWGDGNIETIAGNPGTVTHTYDVGGHTYDILVSARDEDGTFHQSELLVASEASNTIFRFAPTSGDFVDAFGNPGGTSFPVEIELGPDGLLYVSGYTSNDVQRFTTAGAYVDTVIGSGAGMGGPSGLAFGPDGDLFISAFDSMKVFRYDIGTDTLTEFVSTWPTAGNPNDIVFGPDGDLYVADYSTNEILRFDGDSGEYLGAFFTGGGINSPEQMTFGPGGELFVSNNGSNDVLRVSADGSSISVFATHPSLSSITGLEFGPDGHLYVANNSGGAITRFDGSTGAFIDEYVSDGAGGLNGSYYLKFLPSEQVTVVNTNDAPIVTLIGDQAIDEDSTTGALSFTIDDEETAASSLIVTATSSDQSLVQDADIVLGGSGSDRTIQVTSLADQFGSTTITVSIDDGATVTQETFVVNVNPVNDAPVQSTIEGAAINYTEHDGAVAITSTLAIGDVDDANIESATVEISGNYANGEDVLTFVDQNGITGVWDAASGRLALTGSATLANYETAIRSITYTNTSENPDTSTRTISFTVNDGDVDSNTLTRDIEIEAINDDPTNDGSLPSDVTVIEDVLSNVDLSAIDFGDVDASGSDLTVTLSTSTGGELTLAADANLTFGGSATARTITGTLADLNSYFDDPTNIRFLHGISHTFGDNTDTVTVIINDNGNTGTGGGTDQNLGSVNVDITAVNDAPVVAVNTGTTVAEGGSIIITSTMLNEGDVDDSGSELTYTVTSGPTNGRLELSTNPSVAISSFTQDEIDNNRVVFVHDGTQASVDAFNFSLADGGEDGVSPATGTFNFNITNVNDAPVASSIEGTAIDYTENDGAVNVTSTITFVDVDDTNIESAIVQFTAGYNSGEDVLSFTDQNGINGVYDSISGTWTLTGTATLAEYETAIRSITYTNSSEQPDTMTRTVSFTVNDGDVNSNTLTRDIDVTSVNDATVSSSIEGTALSYTENDGAVNVTSSIAFTDVDDTNIESAVVQITGGYNSGEDVLSFTDQNGISGAYDSVSGTWTLSGTATLAEYETAIRSITYTNSSEQPDTTTRTVSFTVNDGDVDSNTLTRDIAITGVNDAPILVATNPSLPSISEDDVNNSGVNIATLLGANVFDVDAGAVEGIAVTQLSSGNGTWQFSTDGGTSWSDVGTVSATNALLLTATDSIRFLPDGENSTSASFDFRAWDQSSGSGGSKVDASTNGGTTAFSSVSDTASIVVSDVNDAPVLTTTGPSLNSISEDAISNTGQSVASLLGGNVSDVDAGAIEGIAVTEKGSSSGSWEYSIDGGTSWIDFGTVSDSQSLLLRANDLVRFVPDGENGEVATFDFRAWDQTVGATGSKVDSTTNGGTSEFSAVEDTASITVNDVNDAPILTVTSPTLPTIAEDDVNNGGQTVASILGANVSDVDSGAVEGIAITGRATSNGVWEYSTDGGTNWTNFGTVSDSQAILLRATDLVRFVPDGENGESTSFDFRAWDQTVGTAGTKVDATTNGGTSEFSSVEDSASITVTSLNDAPVLTVTSPTFPSINEDNLNSTGQTVATLLGANVSDVDPGAIEGIAITDRSGSNGTWEYSLDGGTSWIDFGTISDSQSLLLRPTDMVRFVPDGENGEVATFDFRAWDQTSGTAGSKADSTTNGGTSEFSAVEDSASITVTDVNDAPVLTPTSPTLPTITEDDVNNGGQTVASFLGANVSDVDSGAVAGIAITSRAASSGVWEYSLDGGTSWMNFGAVSDSQSLLLRATDLVRFVPDGENGESSSFDFRAWDQSVGTAGGKVDSTTNGGTSEFSSVADTASISVTDVNDAPVLPPTSPTLPSINEDNLNATGQTIATLLGVNVTDVDSGAIEGIAVTGSDANGSWEYSLDGGTSWTEFGTVSDSQSLLLKATDQVRFVPDGENGESATFDFRAWDQTIGTGGDKVDSTTNGGTSEFSAVEDSVSITVSDVNDAPVLTPNNPSLPTITEDDLNNGGAQVSSILGGSVSDVDNGALEGLAITQLSSGNGVWQYSTDSGTNWIDVGTVSETNALLLNADDFVRFVPDGKNADSASFNFRAWDQTASVNGTKVDVSTAGGTTSISAASDTAEITVTAVNDAPILNVTNPAMPTITEDDLSNSGLTIGTLLGVNETDVDVGALEGIAITGRSASNGQFQYSLDGGISWTNVGSVSDVQSLLLRATDMIRFVPDGENGETAEFHFRGWDLTSGSAGDKVNSLINGGVSEFSAAEDTASITVTDVNDAPVLTANNPSLPSITEDELNNSGTLVSSLLGTSSSDVDNGALEGLAITQLSSGNGTWQYSIDGGASWNDVGVVSESNALLLNADDFVRFVPDGENADFASFDFRAWDQSAGTHATKADATTNGNTTAFSAVSDTADITVTAVNDAPVLAVSNPSLTPITEDDLNPAGDSVASLLGISTTDVDAGSVEGIAITNAAAIFGEWQYSLNGGTSWNSLGTVTGNNALLLRATDLVRYVPDGTNGESATIDFRAWDQSTGTFGSKVDVTTNGGTTAFSSAKDIATIVSASVNDNPVATGEAWNLDEGATLTLDAASGLLANDFDVDVGDVLVPVVETLPAHGNLTVNADGSFEYVHNGSETLTDSFTYKVVDGTGESSVVTVNLSINPINDAPVGQGDTYEVDARSILVSPISVLANDTDAENNPIVAVLIDPPANGFLSFKPDGTFVYTPNSNFVGSETFTYVANDGSVNGAVVTVTIKVNAGQSSDGKGGGGAPISNEKDVKNLESIDEEVIEKVTKRIAPELDDLSASIKRQIFFREEFVDSFPTQTDAEAALNLVFNDFKHYSNFISNEKLASALSTGNTVVFDGSVLLSQLDNLRDKFGSNDGEFHFDLNLTFSTSAIAVTAGYILWTIRGGVLMATMMSSLPTWRFVDPLPILDSNAAMFGEEKALVVFDKQS